MTRRRLSGLAGVLLLSLAVASHSEVLHPGGGSQPLEELPLRMEFGGTGNSEDSFAAGKCVETYVDDNGTPGDTSDDLMKQRSTAEACGVTTSPQPTQTPWDCGAGNFAQGLGATPICLPTPAGGGGGPTVTPGPGTPQPVSTATSAAGTAAGFARIDHSHQLIDAPYEEEAQVGTTAVTGNATADKYLHGTGTGFANWATLDITGASGNVGVLAGDSGTSTLVVGDTISVLTGAGLTSSVAADTVTLTLDPTPTNTAPTPTFTPDAIRVCSDVVACPTPTLTGATPTFTPGILTLTGESGGGTTGTSVAISGNANGIDTVRTGDTIVVQFDTTEVGDATFGNNSDTTVEWTVDAQGAANPILQFFNDIVRAVANKLYVRGATPTIGLEDTDFGGGGYTEATTLTGNCASSSDCTTTLTYLQDSLVEPLISGVADTGIQVGDGDALQITLATDGTGNTALTVPDNSINLTGGAGQEVTGSLPWANIATPVPTPTVTHTASPMPISTQSPGLAGAAAGTSTSMARADHVHPMVPSGVTAGSYTNANVTVNAKGLVTEASSGASIPAGFALYVDKAGTDGASCGPINAPCLTITGATGAHNRILTANDNGFATCSLDPTLGCGRCSTTTTTQCNEDDDCPGVETCTATTSVCSGLSKGTCTGPVKVYQIFVGAGQFNEYLANICVGGTDDQKPCNEATTCVANGGTCDDNQPPSPGYIFYNLTPRTEIYHAADCIVEYTNRTYVTVNGNGENPGGGGQLSSYSSRVAASEWCSFGNGDASALNGVGLVHLGPGWDWRQIGTGNGTNGIHNSVMAGVGSLASANGAYIESYPATCSSDSTRGCIVDGDCAVGQTCTVPASSDWSIANTFLQYGDAKSGTVINVVAKGCGNSVNQFLQDNNAHVGGGASYCVGGSNADALCTTASVCPGGTCTAQTVTFLKLERSSCHASSNATVAATGLRVAIKDIKLRGLEAINGDYTVDVTENIGANTTLEVNGTQSMDHCKRTIAGTLTYATTDQRYAGGTTHLGAIDCAEPPNPVDGEAWYDLTTATAKQRTNGVTRLDAPVRTHATDCTLYSDGKEGEICVNLTDPWFSYICKPTADDCSGSEWKLLTAASTITSDTDCNSVTALSSSYQSVGSLSTWTNTAGTLLHAEVVVGITGANQSTVTCLFRNNGTDIGASSRTYTFDVDGAGTQKVDVDYFWQGSPTGSGVEYFCASPDATPSVSSCDVRRMVFNSSLNLNPVPTITPGQGTPQPVGSATPSLGTEAGYARVDHRHQLDATLLDLAGQSAPRMFSPMGETSMAGVSVGTLAWPSSNQLRCGGFIPPITMLAVTKAQYAVTTAGNGSSCGIAVYEDGGAGAKIFTSNVLANSTTTGLKQVTGTSFTLRAGKPYKVCLCCATATLPTISTSSVLPTGWDNAYVTRSGTAANPCTGTAVMPTTTGTITAATTGIPIIGFSSE